MELIFTNFRKDRKEGKTEPRSRRERYRGAAENAEFAGDIIRMEKGNRRPGTEATTGLLPLLRGPGGC